MPADLASFWSELPIYLAPLLTLIVYVLKELGYFGYKKIAQNHRHTAQTRTISISKIEQREPSNRPPVILSVILLSAAFLLLAFGIFAISVWIVVGTEFQMDFWIVLFIVMFIVIPLYIIVDHFRIESKHYKRGRSHVAKEAIVTVEDNVDAVFDACYRALDSMQAAIRVMEKPNLLRANIRKCVMTIVIRQIEDSKVRVYVVSDSRWLTVKWDGGANQRNIDNFLQQLGRQ